MAGRGSVRASGNFNANQDAEILYKAMKGLGTDEDSIMKLLTSRSNSQRQQIKAAYKTLHGKDLVGDLQGELGGTFETLVVALMTPPILYDVTSLRNAIKGAGTDEKVLIEILSSRTAQQIKDITAAYRQEFDAELEEDVTGDTSGHFRRLLVILLQASRQQGVQEGNIEADAQTLFSAGEKNYGTDEDQFITILGNRSTEHLRRVFAAYMKLAGYEMEESIQRETSGGLRDLLLAVVKCARSVQPTLQRLCTIRCRAVVVELERRPDLNQSDALLQTRSPTPPPPNQTNGHQSTTMAGRGSVRASGNFNANQDAEILYKAMKGLGTDEDSIMKLLTSRSNSQRQQIKAAYKTLHGKDLVGDLKGELGGKFETLVVALMTPPILYDVTSLRNAIKGAGTDEKVLIEILSSRTAQQIKDITAAYRQEFNKNLEEDVTGDTSGHFRRLLVILLQASRQQGVQEGNIEADAQTLFSAGEKKFGTDEEQFITILGNRSTEHLRRVFAAYMKLAGYEMEESIQRETSGGLRDLLLAVVKCARSVPAYFAETLYYSMKGAGTDDQTLIRVMVSRSEVDMLDIRADYRRLFAKSLHSAIQGDTSGDYRKALLLLCGGNDA
ncbi:annexin A5-like [Oncorhynchus kisutch]|nr:annexin A5-like [Oncorhynchus kisutch]